MKKSLLKLASVIGASALVLAGCAEAPNTTPGEPTAAVSPTDATSMAPSDSAAPAADFKACMVSDAGGFDDKSFNETAYAGLTRAKEELKVDTGQIESNAESDFAPNVQSMISADCDIVVTVGFALAAATEAAAKQNPDVKFAIVDNGSFPVSEGSTELVPNAKGLIFNTAESSFLGGYLAASMSQTGKVGTFGGAKYPTVTIFMDGFAQGVAHFNEVKGKSVQVIGWDAEKQDGQFVPGNDPFGNIDGGKNTANTLIAQGADIIFPVAGPAGLGGLQAAQASGGKVNAIWVDTDGCISAAEFCPSIVSSVYKGMDIAVFDAIKAAMDGDFTAEPYVGTLENGGTGLSEFHDFDGKVSAETKSELDKLKADIIAGTIKITSKAQPS
ncbi:BMP family lipoprotein [Tessaracoccus antarcticus]|uniref:BMP family ABC transporter substrate-binding protein n=1 Tax=Tessaracoccus antarcticus TaxID=2479848 RepID=A0A3M0GBH5_9ACTN|nr:BMP family ABC transporter substrate-binding protein [Tessaracoccus antarcticus]RMB58399.1 BMP family ABC transporter substrate-binding protein [Tessaracoccus antarcticus]